MVKGSKVVAPSKAASRKSAGGKITATTPVAKRRAVDSVATVDPACGGCGQMVTDGVRALQCDHCQAAAAWRCAECIGLSSDVYDALVGEGGSSLKWFCEVCEKDIGSSRAPDSHSQKLDRMLDLLQNVMDRYDHMNTRLSEKTDMAVTSQLEARIRSLEERILKLDESVVKMDDRVTGLDDRLHGKVDKTDLATMETELRSAEARLVQFEKAGSGDGGQEQRGHGGSGQSVEDVVIRQLEEDKDIESRKTNILVYRVAESTSDQLEVRKSGDMDFFLDMCHDALRIDVKREDVVKMYRLGRYESGDKLRPLLVSLKSEEMKEEVMKNLNKLKGADVRFASITVGHDLTPRQREKVKAMLTDAKREHGDGAENYRFIVVGQNTRPRVLRIKKK